MEVLNQNSPNIRLTMSYWYFTMIKVLLITLLATDILCNVSNNKVEDAEDTCNLSSELLAEIQAYGPTVEKIIGAVTNGKFKGGTYKELCSFVDKFGARVSGTQNLEDSIDYMLELMTKNGLENVHGEDVMVPHWVRGEESAVLIEPRSAKIEVLSLGSSIGTTGDGIQAEVLVVRSFDELNQSNFSEAAKGKIVVFNNEFVSYGVSVKYRTQGGAQAASHGAVAALIRSVTPFSMSTLHTGSQSQDDVDKIPAVSITVEDANMFQRFQDRGEKIVLKLKVSTQSLDEVTSRNTVGEVVGSEDPQKVVLVSGHLDSWDVGVGAMDDGGGAFISWYSLAVLKSLGLTPKRTVRAVLWTAEEPGYYGVIGYNATHFNELDNFTFVMESDEGTFTPLGLEYSAGKKGGCILREIMKLLAPINATQAVAGTSVGSDISIWTSGLIPGASLLNANERYFWYHHTQADTMDVLDPDALDKATALWASVAYIIADLKEDFPREFDDSLLMEEMKSIVGN